jgi:uncharacterized membrane protein YfhO
VDGRTVPLVAADHALVAVPVPAGTHLVGLRYRPSGRTLGAAISLVSLAVLVAAVLGPALTRRRRSWPDSDPPDWLLDRTDEAALRG